jgi:hypothetical protein
MHLKIYIPEISPVTGALAFIFSAHRVEKLEEADVIIVESQQALAELHPKTTDSQEFIFFASVSPEPSDPEKFTPERVLWVHTGESLIVFVALLETMEVCRKQGGLLTKRERRRFKRIEKSSD